MSFGSSAPGSLGVEEELFLVDAETLVPVPIGAEVVAGGAPRLKPELFACIAEITTPICRDAAEVLDELVRLRQEVTGRASAYGATILAAGTHPTARGAEQQISSDPVYVEVGAQLGPAVSRQLVCGLHVHVAVPDERTCLRALEGVLPWLPDVLSLSANSPFADGEDSGLRSARAERLAELPAGGAPPVFRTWAEWQALTTGVDYRRLHWDVRPHPDYGTLEVRIADQQTDVRRSAALAALVQGLVLAAADAEAEPYDRDLYAERRARAAVAPPERLLLESRPEAEWQLEVGLPDVVRELATRSLE